MVVVLAISIIGSAARVGLRHVSRDLSSSDFTAWLQVGRALHARVSAGAGAGPTPVARECSRWGRCVLAVAGF